MYEQKMVQWLRNPLFNMETMCSIKFPSMKLLFSLCVGRTIDYLSISAPPIPYYFFYARVSCRMCIVPKCAKAMEYLSFWAKSRKEKALSFLTLFSVGYVIPRARVSPGLVNYEGLLHYQLLKPSDTVPAAMGSITALQCSGKEALQGDLGI